jgi:stage II sporulation protein P
MFFRYRFRLVKLYYLNKTIPFFALLILLLIFIIYPLGKVCLQWALNLSSGYANDAVVILCNGLPGNIISPRGSDDLEKKSGSVLLSQTVLALTGVNTKDPLSLLCTELNLARTQEVVGFSVLPLSLEEEDGGEEDYYLPDGGNDWENWIAIPEEEFPPVQLNGEPMVLIYTTHNAEAYKPNAGTSRLEGKNAGIVTVSKTLSRALESKHAIKTIHSENMHDYPDYTKSYFNSMQTVKKFLKQYPKMQVVLDIHRDAGLKTRGDTLVKIKGKDCAKVMIIVGTEHPNWKQNLAFAQKIEAKANELYPGLIKCVRLHKNRRYNQNLHTRALLLEVGSDLNKEEDALEAAKLMADVLAAVLKKE